MGCIRYDGDCPTVLTCSPSMENATQPGVHSAA
jgi:hypothetical protein